ncbi:hypothetical protein AcV5_008650 [Taiwanofungus camphoratus]|nr:hypothetical protein AcV5_008650 [Antrodia cinnamomea]
MNCLRSASLRPPFTTSFHSFAAINKCHHKQLPRLCRTSGQRISWTSVPPKAWRTMSTGASSSGSSPPPRPSRHHVSRQAAYAARNRSLLMYTSAVIVLAVGATYAAVPLYRMFCAATGFAGTPQVGMGKFEAERLVPVENAKRIKVHFNADTSDALPWTFTPQQKFVSVLPGETSLAFYKAKNNSKHDIIGIATYNVTPDRVSVFTSIAWSND